MWRRYDDVDSWAGASEATNLRTAVSDGNAYERVAFASCWAHRNVQSCMSPISFAKAKHLRTVPQHG